MNTYSAITIIIVSLFGLHCSNTSNPTNAIEVKKDYAALLEITTEQTEYSMSKDFTGGFAVFKGTITNSSQDTFYSNIGSGAIASMEQNNVHVAYGSNGVFEKYVSPNKWEKANQALLIEGSKVVRLLPKKSYPFDAPIMIDSNSVGKYRISIYFFRSYTQSIIDTLKDTSNTFYLIN